jgi:hypothetical protein
MKQKFYQRCCYIFPITLLFLISLFISLYILYEFKYISSSFEKSKIKGIWTDYSKTHTSKPKNWYQPKSFKELKTILKEVTNRKEVIKVVAAGHGSYKIFKS